MKKSMKYFIIVIMLSLLSLTAITSYSRYAKTITKTGTIATADVGYCQINGITSFKECLIRNDSQQTLSLALNTIDTRTSSLNLNNIEPVNAYVPKTTYTNVTNKTNTTAITNTTANRFTYVTESKLINPFDVDDTDITKISFNSSTGYYTWNSSNSITGNLSDIITTPTDIANGVYKYACLNTTNTGNCTTLFLFTEDPYLISGSYRFKQGYSYSYTVTGTSTSNAGLYKGEDDYTVDSDTYTYFYRGDVNNNWVKFGNYLWRVVRINGDGSIRMIYSGLASSSNHTGSNAQIKTSAYGDTQSFTATTTDLYDSSKTVTTTYSNGRYGNTNVGYMYNPAKVIGVYPNKDVGSANTPAGGYKLNYFPTFTNISNATNYYFFKNFDPSTDCFTGSDSDESGACTLKCRSLGNDGDSGIDCVQSNWNTLATTSGNYSTTDPGVYSTQYVYKSDYKYTCWGYGTPVTKANGDGTTSVYITCPVVSEIIGTVNNQPTQAKVKYRGLFSADATTANTNVKDSKIKSEVDTWYATNILNANDGNGNALEDYLSDEIFCNDRSSTSADFPLVNSGSYLYGPYSRNTATNRVPSFRCPNKSNDAFTLKTSGGVSSVTASGDGNNKLTYPVGLITIDEAAYAGGKNGSMNYKYYLYTGTYYWTMSPSYFSSSSANARVWNVYSTGLLNNSNSASAYGVRPVVNLNSDVLYSGGTGTESDPYIITLPSGS